MICSECGCDNPEQNRFCGRCGTRLPEAGDRSIGTEPTRAPSRGGQAGEVAAGVQASVGETPTVAAEEDKSVGLGEVDEVTGRRRYEVVEELGHGGMGIVYKARDTRLNRIVAIKRITPIISASRVAVDRFLNEAHSIAALSHYNIVQVFDVDHDEDGHYIVMEFIDGESLAERIRREGKMTVEAAVSLDLWISVWPRWLLKRTSLGQA